ncbi:MAG: flagellar hook-associated protein FlgK [candidate division FCPU426 bacterium]
MFYSTFFGIEIGKRALESQQMAQTVVSHNIANAATAGYSRQLVSLAATDPLNMASLNRQQTPGQLGTGVNVSSILRVRDMMLEGQIQRETGVGAAWDTKKSYLGQVEQIVQEPTDQGLSQSLEDFWAAWQELSVYPDDIAVRNVLLSRAETVVNQLQSMDADLEALQRQADQAFRSHVERINELGSQIRDLNVQINQSLGMETPPNDLLDKRDGLLRELSELTDFEGHEMTNGLYAVTINGHTLVQDNIFVPLQVVDDPMNNNYAMAQWSDDGSTLVYREGKLAGLTEVRDTYLPGYRSSLNDLALGLMNSINPVHAAGYALNAAAPSGQVFFTGIDLQTMAVNPILTADPTQLAAATQASAPGDGSNALAIAQLQSALILSGGTQTAGEFYQEWIAQVGLDSEESQVRLDTQNLLVSGLEQQQESLVGVNLDEEMTNLMRYQDAYQAAIRVVSAMDEMLNQLINQMGLVGR